MTDARWFEIDRDLARSHKHFRLAIRLFEANRLGGNDFDSEVRTLAFLHAMLSGYAACEAAFIRLLEMIGEDMPVGRDWHKQLLTRLSHPLTRGPTRPAIISRSLANELEELRKFRHIAMHVYDDFQSDRAVRAVDAAEQTLRLLNDEIDLFRKIIDPD
jgi:hypothetical protein